MKQLKAVVVLAASLAFAGAAAPAFAAPADHTPLLGGLGNLGQISELTNGITDVSSIPGALNSTALPTEQALGGTGTLGNLPSTLPLGK